MAERRMLHRKASVSSDLDALRREHGAEALAFALLMIPFYDRWGCVADDPGKLRAMVCPMWDTTTAEDVKRWTDFMVKRRMLRRVRGAGGAHGLQNVSFAEHQSGTQFDREAISPYEPTEVTAQWAQSRTDKPKPVRLQGVVSDSRATPEKVKTDSSQRKGKEGKGREVNPSFSLPLVVESAAPSAESEALPPQPPTPGVEVNPPSAEEIDAHLSPELRAARRRGRVSGQAEQTRRDQRAQMDAAAQNGAPLTEEAARSSVEFLRRKAVMEGADDS